MFIGLNPSTANETDNDATISNVTRICKDNGFGGFYMMNCFPIISTDPKVLKDFYLSPVSYVQHQYSINNNKLKEVGEKCESVVFAWGSFAIVRELNRDKELIKMFPNAKALRINKNGSPHHPLYLPKNIKLIPFTT